MSPSLSPSPLQTLRATRSYPSSSESLILNDIHSTLTRYPSLHLSTADFKTRTTTASKPLLALRGTIPVTYKQNLYAIPIHIWLMPYYPKGPPIVFVVPTKDMAFRKGHAHVDCTNGMVYLPYFAQWDANRGGDLCTAVVAMIKAFELKPPVYARLHAGETQLLVKGLTGRLQHVLQDIGREKLGSLLISSRATHDLLMERRRQLHTLESRVSKLEGGLEAVRRRKTALERWVVKHPNRVDDVNRDVWHRCAVRELEVGFQAGDRALTDGMALLDECVVAKVLKGAGFVERVRRLARDQFYQRLMAKKIAWKLKEMKEGRGRGKGGGLHS